MSSISFGTNIDSILDDILVTKSKLEELIGEIKNLSNDNIDASNALVVKLMGTIQHITERTDAIEDAYSKFLSVRNSFLDMEDWDNKVYPDIKKTFEDDLNRYLQQLLSLESICEEFFVSVIEEKIAENNTLYNIDKNVYNNSNNDSTKNKRMKDFIYGESVGYGWHSIKASDAYLRDTNTVLNISKFDDTEWNEMKSICKGSVLHETVSFHPSFGLMHIMTNSRERVVSSYVDQETHAQFFTHDIKNCDGFEGEMNEIKGSYYNRPVTGIDRNALKEKVDLSYGLIMRHKILSDVMQSLDGNEYFILKMRDYEPLKDGTPNNFLIQRVNLELVNVNKEFNNGNTRDKYLHLNSFLTSFDQDFTEKQRVIESKVDNNEKMVFDKIVDRIVKAAYWTNTVTMNIKGSDISMLLRYQYKDNQSKIQYMDFVILDKNFTKNALNHFITNTGKYNKKYDLLSNLVLQVLPPDYTHIGNAISYDRNLPNMKDKGMITTNDRFQIVNSSNHGFYDVLSINELDTYYKSNDVDVKIPTNTLIDKLIKLKGNRTSDKLFRFNMQEYYDVFANPLRRNNYYFAAYTKNITLAEGTNNKILPKIAGNYNINYINNYNFITDENRPFRKCTFDTLHPAKCTTFPGNRMIRNWIANEVGNVVAICGPKISDCYYSTDYGYTWERCRYDRENSTLKIGENDNVFSKNGVDSAGDMDHVGWPTNLRMTNDGVSLFIAGHSNGPNGLFFKTLDGGKTFTTHNNMSSRPTEVISFNRKGLVVCAFYNIDQVSLSKDWGNTWEVFSANSRGASGVTDYHEIAVFDDNSIWLCGHINGNHQMIVSEDGGKTFRNVSMPVGQAIAIATSGFERGSYLSCWYSNNSCVVSLDGGKTWTNRNIGPEMNYSSPVFKQDINGFCFYSRGTTLYANINMMASTTGNASISIERANAPMCFIPSKNLILVQGSNNAHIQRITYKTRILNYDDDISPTRAARNNIGRTANISRNQFNDIKKEVSVKVGKYLNSKNTEHIGKLTLIPYIIDENVLTRYIKCDGRVVSKEKYKELYTKIGDKYITDGSDEVPEGYFRIPDFRGKTFVGTDNINELGLNIENALPSNMKFKALFKSDSANNESSDIKYGPFTNESSVNLDNSKKIGLVGGFEYGMDREKLKISHKSTSQITKGNDFALDVYIRAL